MQDPNTRPAFRSSGGMVEILDDLVFDEWMYRDDYAAALLAGSPADRAARQLVMDFEVALARTVAEARVDQDIDRVLEAYLTEDYIQHDPPIGNGRRPLAAWFRRGGAGATPPPPVAIATHGDLVCVMLQLPAEVQRLLQAPEPVRLTAWYRIRDNKLSEHWGVLSLLFPELAGEVDHVLADPPAVAARADS